VLPQPRHSPDLSQALTGEERTAHHQPVSCHPEFDRPAKTMMLHAPAQGALESAQQETVQTRPRPPADHLRDFVIQHEKRHAAVHIAIRFTTEPREYVGAKGDRAPAFERLRLLHTEPPEFGPDWNSGIRCEDI